MGFNSANLSGPGHPKAVADIYQTSLKLHISIVSSSKCRICLALCLYSQINDLFGAFVGVASSSGDSQTAVILRTKKHKFQILTSIAVHETRETQLIHAPFSMNIQAMLGHQV